MLLWILQLSLCICPAPLPAPPLPSSNQVLYYREDPRIREQEWGNFQDPSLMEKVMDERRRIGAFFYRFATGER